MVEEKIYTDTVVEGCIIRKFSNDIDPIELMWHRDLRNRRIKIVSGNGWKIQLDNQLPVDIQDIVIHKLEWHRVIKGDGDLIVSIEEFD